MVKRERRRLVLIGLAAAAVTALTSQGAAAASPIRPKLEDWRGTQSGAPGVRNVALDVSGPRGSSYGNRVSAYGINLYPLSCEDGKSRSLTVPRSAWPGYATEDDVLDIGAAHLKISRRGQFSDAGTFVKLFHVFPPVQVTYELTGRFTSATSATGTVRATLVEDTRGEDWLAPDFRPENVTRCSGQATWSACFQRSLGDRSACLGTPSQEQVLPEPTPSPEPPDPLDPGG
jgi:hypothetical protein